LFPGFQIHFVQTLEFLHIAKLEIVQKNELLTLVFVQKLKCLQIKPCFRVSVSFCRSHKILTNENLFPGFPVHLRDLQLQGEEVGPLGDDAAGRVHGRLH
jgi:hypothetical protein